MTPEPKTFDLKFPFAFRGQNYASFTARDPKVRDLKKFVKKSAADPVAAVQDVLTDLCEVGEGVMEEIHVSDFSIMRKWFENFFDDDADA